MSAGQVTLALDEVKLAHAALVRSRELVLAHYVATRQRHRVVMKGSAEARDKATAYLQQGLRECDFAIALLAAALPETTAERLSA